MAKQSFAPVDHGREVKSQLVKTPDLGKIRHHFLVRMLIVERIRCIMDNVTFTDGCHSFIAKYLTVPPHYTEQDQIDNYIKSETLEVVAAFNRYEENAVYQDDLKALNPFKGHRWHLVSATDSGVLITIEIGN